MVPEIERMGAVGLWVNPADLPLILSMVEGVLDNVEPEDLGDEYARLQDLADQVRFQLASYQFLKRKPPTS